MDIRWWILIFCSIHGFCADFFNEAPSVVVQRLLGTATDCTTGTDRCLSLDLYEYNLVFGLNTYFSAFAAILAGVVIDWYGSKFALWVCAFFIFLGPLLFALAPYATGTSAFTLLLIGRLFYGLGAGGTVVILHRMKASWFLYRELALSFSVAIVLGRLGSATCFLLLGAFIDQVGLRGCLWLAFGISLVASVSAVVLAYLDQHGAAIYDTAPPDTSFHSLWSVTKQLDGMFWTFAVMSLFYYGTIYLFVANGPNYLAMHYGVSESIASYITGIVFDISLLGPISGWLTDRFGYRERWLNASALALFIGLLLLFLVPQAPPGLWIILIGLGYTIYAPTVWSSIPLVVPHDAVGLATGMGKFFQYIGTGTLAVAAGAILDMNNSKRIVPWDAFFIFAVCTSAVCVLTAAALWYLNRAEQRLTPTQMERDLQHGVQEITPLNVGYGSNLKLYEGIAKSADFSVHLPDVIRPRLAQDRLERSVDDECL